MTRAVDRCAVPDLGAPLVGEGLCRVGPVPHPGGGIAHGEARVFKQRGVRFAKRMPAEPRLMQAETDKDGVKGTKRVVIPPGPQPPIVVLLYAGTQDGDRTGGERHHAVPGAGLGGVSPTASGEGPFDAQDRPGKVHFGLREGQYLADPKARQQDDLRSGAPRLDQGDDDAICLGSRQARLSLDDTRDAATGERQDLDDPEILRVPEDRTQRGVETRVGGRATARLTEPLQEPRDVLDGEGTDVPVTEILAEPADAAFVVGDRVVPGVGRGGPHRVPVVGNLAEPSPGPPFDLAPLHEVDPHPGIGHPGRLLVLPACDELALPVHVDVRHPRAVTCPPGSPLRRAGQPASVSASLAEGHGADDSAAAWDDTISMGRQGAEILASISRNYQGASEQQLLTFSASPVPVSPVLMRGFGVPECRPTEYSGSAESAGSASTRWDDTLPDVVGAIGPDRWAEAWGVFAADRAAESKIQRDLAETLHAAGRLSTPARDAIVADAGKFDDMAVGS